MEVRIFYAMSFLNRRVGDEFWVYVEYRSKGEGIGGGDVLPRTVRKVLVLSCHERWGRSRETQAMYIGKTS